MPNPIEQAEALTAQRMNFARDLADPNFSLSVPDTVKAVIRDLIREVGRLDTEHKRVLAERTTVDEKVLREVDRIRVAGVIHSMIPDVFNGITVPKYELCEDNSCLWYDIADALRDRFRITEKEQS